MITIILLFRKLAKFIYDQDVEWPSKLQPACLSANIHKKRATKYSPFQLMFGRVFDHLPLLRRLNLDTDEDIDDILSDEMVVNDQSVEHISVLTDNTEMCSTDWSSDLTHNRNMQIVIS